MADKVAVIEAVCHALRRDSLDDARRLLMRDYPFAPGSATKRRHTVLDATWVFVRDGFVDRYSGTCLVFPPVLRILSAELPTDFPYHPNWKPELTHPAYWELGATVDHEVPVSRGGADDDSNWVTTSMGHNSAKGNWTLTELGWTLRDRGDFKTWDGLVHWFLAYTDEHSELVTAPLRKWHRAAKLAVTGDLAKLFDRRVQAAVSADR
jgi:hypothetical protein